ATWTAWQTAATITTTNATGSSALTATARCFQYRATMSTTNTAQTPVLQDVTVNYQVSANYNFSLTSSASTDIVAGAAATKISTITVTVQNPQDASITDAVNFSATVSPSGPAISFSPSSSCLPGSGTCAVDLYASSAATGNYTITVRGNNASGTYPNGLTKDIAVSLTALPQMVYTLALTAYQGEVIKESATSAYPTPTVETALTITRSGGADEGITDITHNAPAGITMNASPPNSAPFGTTFVSTITFSAASTVASGDYAFTITITPVISGAGNAQSLPFTLKVRNPLSYSLSASPNNGAVFQGNSVASTINGVYGGYPAGTENAAFTNFSSASNPGAFSSVPAEGVISVSFLPSTCTLGAIQTTCAKSATISTSSNTTPGTYTITISSVSSITNTMPAPAATYTLTVSGPFDFTMAMGAPIAPCTLSTGCTAEQGTSINVAVDVSSISAAGENVAFSINGLPADISSSVVSAPALCSPSLGVSCVVTFTISPVLAAQTKSYAINLVGTSANKMHSLPFSLTVSQGFTFDITLSASSGVATRGGASANVTATITLGGGTPKSVMLDVNGLAGSGVVMGYLPGQSCAPNCSAQITFTAPTSAAWCGPDGRCTYNINITGTYGTQVVQKPYTLTVVDPFDFSLSLSSVQGSIMQGGNIQAVATLGWLAGGSGTEAISLNASVLPSPAPILVTDIVNFNSDSITGLDSSTSPLHSTVTLTAPGGLASNSYTIIVIATSGTLVKTKTYNLTVGTTLDFTLTLLPDNERVMQGASSAPVLITATNNIAQPATSDISFVIGDTPKYRLPKDVTVTPSTIPSCTLGAALNATCASSLIFNVGPTAVDGTYLIPIVGTSGFVNRIVYYTLKVGLLDLVDYVSPDFMTDGHMRPQAGFTWSPSAVFAGDTVQFDAASSTVYVAGQPGFVASTPVSGVNADFNWSFAGIAGGSTLINPSVLYPTHGVRDVSLAVTDKAGGCYTSTSSGAEPCACTVSSATSTAVPKVDVSLPRPSFREITPQ
ncbi:hypothetical protein HY839_00125, partial [Candidatus Azambacteria bacterium]|nr:hypothetical protein [Candidatus Azambacteria bacterium]